MRGLSVHAACAAIWQAHCSGPAGSADASAERSLTPEGDLDGCIIGAQLEGHVWVALPGALHRKIPHQPMQGALHAKAEECSLHACSERLPILASQCCSLQALPQQQPS